MSASKYQLNATAYTRIGAPQTVINWILNGIKVPFSDIPNKCFYSNRVNTRKQYKFVNSEIKKLVKNGTIQEVDTKPHCILAIQCAPKKNGKLRLVIDSRPVNVNIVTPKFNQEGITAVAEQIEAKDLLISIDLKDGFHHCPITPEHWRYFRMKWGNKYYVWRYFPFGVSCAPYYFYKLLRPVVKYLCQNNLHLASFVDDFLLMLKKITATDHKDFAIQCFQECGWCLNFEKCELKLTMEKNFVGFNVSTWRPEGPWVKVLSAKIRKLRRAIQKALSLKVITARNLARLIGQCVAMAKAIMPAKLLLRNAYRLLSSRSHWEDSVYLTDSVKKDLQWWLSALKGWNGAPLLTQCIDIQMETDASGSGWGGTAKIGNSIHNASGQWKTCVSYQHSNFRELMAVYRTLQSMEGLVKGKNVQILSDNITTVAYINHLGGPSQHLSDLMSTIWVYAHSIQVNLTAKFLAGRLNEKADLLSRIVSPYNWCLNPQAFAQIDQMWGPHTMDRFASMDAHLVAKYNSMYLDPYTAGVDALAQDDWNREMNFCNPPFWLIPKVLRTVVKQGAEATLIAPLWKGQHWTKRLKELSICPPLLLKNCPGMFYNRLTVAEPCKNRSWKIFAWRISGRKS